MTQRIPLRGLDPGAGVDGDSIVISNGEFVVAPSGGIGAFAPSAGRSPRLVPYGVKLRGANINPPYNPPNSWGWLYNNWATMWPQVVKPQIEHAASVGANAIRLIGDVEYVLDGTISLETYLAAYEQFVDYCGNLDLWVYACLSDPRHWGSFTRDQVLTVMRAQAAMLESKPNVFAIDVAQEVGLTPTSWSGTTELELVDYLLTSVREVTTLPLTCSVLGGNNSSTSQWSDGTVATFDGLVDFFDYHPYYDGMAPADLAPVLGATTKPVILGEFGSGTSDPARYSEALAVSELQQVVGSFAWAIADRLYDPTGAAYGMFDTAFNERTALTTIFRTVPAREQFTTGHIVEEEGAALPARSRLNFVGDVTATDDPTNDATVVTVTIPDPPTATVSSGEVLMQDGVTGPPVPLETEARDDWLYQG